MYTLGIDIGSTTSKCVLMENGTRICASSIVTAGIGTEGVNEALNLIYKQSGIDRSDVCASTVTGYGRMLYKDADYEVSELSCHALGGRFIYPDIRTIIDIGGQDAKVISLNEKGKMQEFLMNDKCAAGTGRFLDVMANILKLNINDMGKIALQSDHAASISSTCTVFAESEVISQLAQGEAIANVVAGICDSVALRVAGFARRVGVKEKVCMSGGVAQNIGVRTSLERILETEILVSEYSQLFGAIGAAIYAFNKKEKEI